VSAVFSLDRLTDCGAHKRGHFQLSSGLHSPDYLQCALFLSDPGRAEAAGRLLATAIRGAGEAPDVVVAPALGGLIIGHEVARALDRPFLFTERSHGAMTLRRGFAVHQGERAVVVEDVVTTGISSRETLTVVEAGGAQVVGVASIVNRSGRSNPFDPLLFHTLLEVSFPTWVAEECPLCRQGVPVDKPGSRSSA